MGRSTKFSLMAFIIKAFSSALNHYPKINSHYYEEKPFEYVQYRDHNLTIAIDSAHGLAVPNIKACQEKSIAEISEEISRLRALANEGKLGSNDLLDGTVTLSNVGNIGGTYVGPVVLPPQIMIVGMGGIQTVPRYLHKDYTKTFPRSIVNKIYADCDCGSLGSCVCV